MKLKSLFLSALLACALTSHAQNTKTKVAQVTDAVALTDDVDYIITGDKPFATTGSIDIQNLDHAVIIFQKIKPSKVISSGLLKNIYINGQPAVAGDLTSNNATVGSNCQVKMYNRGTIIMPYGQNFRPLTCYTEKDFEGNSCNDYTEGSSGGYMKSLTSSNLNNNFKSFVLKRGYMVTFALGTGGWGYSRCFIADTEDLRMNLPTNMSGRVSSYRLFKWWDASKAGIHDTSAKTNDALNTTSCFDWAQGNASLLPDVEWVPNHIYEDWPSSATCGGVTGSCHMKTNNEPGNSADDHPQSVEEVLNNWQNLMRTGMRLCSESSHDGSMGHLKDFINAIDARGWRCDVLDLHGYWTGQWWNLDWYRSEYGKGRPIWFSEWVYGSSWGNAGIFNNPPDGRNSYSKANQQRNYELVKPVLEILNSKDYVERYYYWNSEADCSKIYKDGQVSILGKYYAEMETGLAYNKKNEYVPTVVYSNPGTLTGTYTKTKNTFTLSWSDPNGDMLDSVVVQAKTPNSSVFKYLARVPLKDMGSKEGAKYTFDTTPEAGATYYRVAVYPIGSRTPKYSNEASVTISSSLGTNMYQFGNLELSNTEAINTDFSEQFSTTPAVFMGVMTNKSTKLFPANVVKSPTRAKFTYQLLVSNLSKDYTTIEKQEDLPFLAIQDTTNYDFAGLACEVGNAKISMMDTVYVEFRKPFAEGITPIVLTELRHSTLPANGIHIRISDVTNKGFKAICMYEEGVGKKSALKQNMNYLAIEPGVGSLDAENNIIIAAGTYDESYGITARIMPFVNGEEQYYFAEPYIFANLQTYNFHSAAVLRRQADVTETEAESPYYQAVSGTRIKRLTDVTTTTTDKNTKDFADTVGWVVIAQYKEGLTAPTAISSPTLTADTSRLPILVNNRRIMVLGTSNYSVYNTSGAKVNHQSTLTPGIYVVKSGLKSEKVIVK